MCADLRAGVRCTLAFLFFSVVEYVCATKLRNSSSEGKDGAFAAMRVHRHSKVGRKIQRCDEGASAPKSEGTPPTPNHNRVYLKLG